jgi:hypothetical protein
MRIVDENSVCYAGPIAGMTAGICGKNRKILGTESPNLITPKARDWQTLDALFHAVLYDGECVQLTYFCGWLRTALISLHTGKHSCGQAVVFAGEEGSGKSLLQNLITTMLGGRCAKPYHYMIGKTNFNADLFGAEHLMIEDEAPYSSFHDRRKFGTELKQISVNYTQRLHTKGRDVITLIPLYASTFSDFTQYFKKPTGSLMIAT